jgi:hypothetical protein
LSALAVPSVPAVRMHDLDVPRIGFVHSWVRTQDEGWWRLAFDRLGVPYDYFADQRLKEGNLRARYDVIVYPHVGGSAQSHVHGVPMTGGPLPYRKSADTPHLGVQDQSPDIRGGMGLEGLSELVRFVEQGGTLIVEGSTLELMAVYGVTRTIAIESPENLFVRGSILKAAVGDATSPIAYGLDGDVLPVYFNQGPVVNAGGAAAPRTPSPAAETIPGVGLNLTPNAQLPDVTTLPATGPVMEPPPEEDVVRLHRLTNAQGAAPGEGTPRVVLRFPDAAGDLLLSGSLVGGQALAGRAVVLDVPLGDGHIVMFAARPFWRGQTQGSYFLALNALLNWNDLDEGADHPAEAGPDRDATAAAPGRRGHQNF